MYGNYDGARERLVKIFEDTRERCRTDEFLSEAVQKANAGQKFIPGVRPLTVARSAENDRSGAGNTEAKKPLEIKVSGKRSLEAASAYRGKRICVHNFASATNPGGGVTKGSRAQEECLCRCSTLYANLSEPRMRTAFYSRHKTMLGNGEMTAAYNDDCIYTPGVIVFKSDTDNPALLPQKDWFSVDVITCAAPNLRERPSNRMNPGSGSRPVRLKHSELRELHRIRAKRILDIARQQGVQVLILGAFGCGAFENPPLAVAEGYALALGDYRYDFETVEFAVYCSPGKTENYDVFKRALGGLRLDAPGSNRTGGNF